MPSPVSSLRMPLIGAFALLSPIAAATQGRVDGLSGNKGFADDTDVLLYPSALGEVDDGVNLNYQAGIDGGVTWGNQHMFWINRDGAPPNSAGPGMTAPFSAVYGQGDGSTGWLARTSWRDGLWTVGGGWSKGGYGRETQNLAFGGDIFMEDDGGDGPKPWVSAYAAGRNLQANQLMAWNARFTVNPDNFSLLEGGAQFGPRWGSDQLRAALSIGPGLTFVNVNPEQGDSVNSLGLDIPSANLAAEYELREWVSIRGSATAGWRLDVADISDFDETKAFSARAGGALGMGFKHADTARLDVSISPTWAVQGPALLSGVGSPMFFTVSGRFLL